MRNERNEINEGEKRWEGRKVEGWKGGRVERITSRASPAKGEICIAMGVKRSGTPR